MSTEKMSFTFLGMPERSIENKDINRFLYEFSKEYFELSLRYECLVGFWIRGSILRSELFSEVTTELNFDSVVYDRYFCDIDFYLVFSNNTNLTKNRQIMLFSDNVFTDRSVMKSRNNIEGNSIVDNVDKILHSAVDEY